MTAGGPGEVGDGVPVGQVPVAQVPDVQVTAAFESGLGDDLAAAALALSRRFAAGATLWCLAPDWPEHARHVAVEFVHPVIMGKRALPAVNVEGRAAVAALRTRARPGDVALVVATGDHPTARAVAQRSPVWGITTIWIGWGARPPAGAADHVVWLDAGAGTAAVDGRLVLLYHVLWELTHVCFEHPGLLTSLPQACEGPTCTTCADEGRLAEVVALTDAGAAVRTATGSELVDTTVLGPLQPGDLVLVHAGTAIAIVEADGADA